MDSSDAIEKLVHDRTDDHGFGVVEAGLLAGNEEVPYAGPGMQLDYKQPGFAFTDIVDGQMTPKWRSFVQGVECDIPATLSVEEGQHLIVVAVVQWTFASKAIPPPKPVDGVPPDPEKEELTWKYATSEYAVQSVTFGVYDSSDIPERELVSFLDTYNQKGKDNFGHDFNDTETIVCDLGSIQNGVLVNHTDGNLFFSKFGPDTSTSLVPIN